MNNELYHYGVKGMKWGVRRKRDKSSGSDRKQARATRKVENAYAKAGAARGQADYILSKGRKQASRENSDARMLEKASKDYASQGKNIRAGLTRYAANIARSNAKDAMQKAKEEAEYFVQREKYMTVKAQTIATKKNVNLGKNRVNEILSSSRREGREYQRNMDEIEDAYR